MARRHLDDRSNAPRRAPEGGGRGSRWRRTAASAGVAIGIAVVAAATSCASGSSTPSDPKLAQGQDVYRTRCMSCHGAGGGGGSAPRLIGIADRMTEQQEIDTITNGVDGTAMPAWGGTLSADEIAAVAAYTRTLTPTE